MANIEREQAKLDNSSGSQSVEPWRGDAHVGPIADWYENVRVNRCALDINTSRLSF